MDEAFEHMNDALKNRLGRIVFLKINPIWEFIRKDQRFHDIINEFNKGVID